MDLNDFGIVIGRGIVGLDIYLFELISSLNNPARSLAPALGLIGDMAISVC